MMEVVVMAVKAIAVVVEYQQCTLALVSQRHHNLIASAILVL